MTQSEVADTSLRRGCTLVDSPAVLTNGYSVRCVPIGELLGHDSLELNMEPNVCVTSLDNVEGDADNGALERRHVKWDRSRGEVEERS